MAVAVRQSSMGQTAWLQRTPPPDVLNNIVKVAHDQTQPGSQSSLALGGSKMRDPGNKVASISETKVIILIF